MARRRKSTTLPEVKVKGRRGKVRLRTRLATDDGWWALAPNDKVVAVRDEDIKQ